MQDLLQSWHDDDNLSIVIVRHPMSRLASVYYQKFVELSTHKGWARVSISTLKQDRYFISFYQIISKIIRKYRKNTNEGPPDQPTPNEYLRLFIVQLFSKRDPESSIFSYILDNLKSAGAANVDQHWRPQHLSCPFCLLQFR